MNLFYLVSGVVLLLVGAGALLFAANVSRLLTEQQRQALEDRGIAVGKGPLLVTGIPFVILGLGLLVWQLS